MSECKHEQVRPEPCDQPIGVVYICANHICATQWLPGYVESLLRHYREYRAAWWTIVEGRGYP
jgi:hypothetical protein